MWRYLPLISRECCFGSSFGQFDNLENEVGHFLMAVLGYSHHPDICAHV